LLTSAGWFLFGGQVARGHEGHEAATYYVTSSATDVTSRTHLRLQVQESESNQLIAARFTLTVDGRDYVPEQLGEHGLRFVSRHQRKRNRFVVTYARGSGEVLIPLPEGAVRGTVTATKGFEFVAATVSFEVRDGRAGVQVALRRWIDLQAEGWHAADEHLHYERTDPAHDSDWLTILDADGLSHAHFLVLKGGNLDGVWADQFAYGPKGEANDGQRLITPGEEYRDTQQGHINLLGIAEVIPPISTGGMGKPNIPFNYPPLFDVFRRTHELGGIGGPAHGGSFSRNSTALMDTILGEVDFFEIANSALHATDVWYDLLNCGYLVPPVAGTDLPNCGFRDSWQPFFGEVRTYVRVGEQHNFGAWKDAVRRGETFVTSGPVIRISVNGSRPGTTVRLPKEGGNVTIVAELASPRPLKTLRLIVMGERSPVEFSRTQSEGIHRLTITHSIRVSESCWIAARGLGEPKTAIEQGLHDLGLKQSVMAHTGIVGVIVDGEPIRSEKAVESVGGQLAAQREYYRSEAKFERAEHRLRFLELFERAMQKLADSGTSMP
jgi:hypothetical protein